MAEPKRQDLESDHRGRSGRDGGGRYAGADGVAATLRAARLALGLDLAQVAGALCIQFRYLEAIEDGRFEDLPGPTYALGFVRAYAEFLRLDGRSIIGKFKDEVRGLSRRQALVFPEPLQEGRFPGGVVLLVALLFAAGIYGGWYYWEHSQMTASDAVPPVPASLANMVPANPPPAATLAPSEAQASSATTAVPGETPAAAASGGAAAPPPLLASPGQSPAAAPAPAPAAPEASAAPPATAAQPAPIALQPPLGTAPSDAAKAASAAPGSGNQATPLAPPAPDQIAALKPGDTRVYGESNVDSRITLTARQDSWVQVRDRDGNVIWTRILRRGDVYRVPNQGGLAFATGNAGALDVSVDGKPAPSLGAIGMVRHNVPLDPGKLMAGTLSNP
ncbi:MAG TPA: RodZ domain-containing protein [Alphaproteobacteria bacterium]|nr:RodZ domain-containing protein [Alphaproteobacteria bacterium]